MMMGNAAHEAATRLRDVLAGAAAKKLEVDTSQLVFEDRCIVVGGDGERSVTIEDAIALAETEHGALSYSGSYKPELKFGDFKGSGVGPSPAYSFSACVVHVSVDQATGIAKPLKVWMAHDIGRCISRTNVEGQIEGGIYMALGEILMEEMAYTRQGLLKNPNLLDYKIPTSLDMPEIEQYIIESAEKTGPFGAKEAGQGPLLPVIPAFNNALYDAIGIRFDEVPVTPDKILRALERKEKRVGPRKTVDFEFPPPIKSEVPADATSQAVRSG
jgi:CO/xanthine dehydrogenase Mo-binding subunit